MSPDATKPSAAAESVVAVAVVETGDAGFGEVAAGAHPSASVPTAMSARGERECDMDQSSSERDGHAIGAVIEQYASGRSRVQSVVDQSDAVSEWPTVTRRATRGMASPLIP